MKKGTNLLLLLMLGTIMNCPLHRLQIGCRFCICLEYHYSSLIYVCRSLLPKTFSIALWLKGFQSPILPSPQMQNC